MNEGIMSEDLITYVVQPNVHFDTVMMADENQDSRVEMVTEDGVTVACTTELGLKAYNENALSDNSAEELETKVGSYFNHPSFNRQMKRARSRVQDSMLSLTSQHSIILPKSHENAVLVGKTEMKAQIAWVENGVEKSIIGMALLWSTP
ncbi:hypothetical protein IW262DRAFT_1302298 [Armillaria fumosa]|nr:hypothetical protein IW262DRAFT_1302298 [Armillaria fumosa]